MSRRPGGVGRIAALLIALLSVTVAQAQATGAICARPFTDTNRNGVRDPGEAPLADVNESVLLNSPSGAVVIANHLSDGKAEPYCFMNLSPGAYTLSFGTALSEATTPASFPITLRAGEQPVQDFGGTARYVPPPVPAGLVITLTRPVRIGLATAGALLVMLSMAALGLVVRGVYGIIARR